jgi:hypothetical protein
MKIGFTGDVYLGNIEKYTNNPFINIQGQLKNYNLVINFESPIIDEDINPIKNKICLKHNSEEIKKILSLKPFLLNLSNNHINDYGDYGVENTKKQLEKLNLNYFGVGYSNENHHIFISKKEKIAFFTYASRECDLSKNKLFDEDDFQGPKELSLKRFKKDISRYKNHKKIVLIHWGLEQMKYPKPLQRKLAQNLIDSGADLIIGNHPHVIQGYEIYKNKYVFYSLGNFIFPHVKRSLAKSSYQNKENKESIIPIFEINNKIILRKLLKTCADKNFNLNIDEENNYLKEKEIKIDLNNYNGFYLSYIKGHNFYKKLKGPIRIIKKIYFHIKNG